MAKYFDLPNSLGALTDIKGTFSNLKNNDYVVTQLQNNIQVLIDQVTTKVQASKKTASIVARSEDVDLTAGDKIPFNVEQADPQDLWSSKNSLFKIAADGYYVCVINLSVTNATPVTISLVYNGTTVATIYDSASGTDSLVTKTYMRSMAAGDTLYMTVSDSVTINGSSGGFQTQFALRW